MRVSRAALEPSDVVVRHGLPATSITRTLIDLGRKLPLTESVAVVDMALHAGRVRFPDLAAAVERQAGTRNVAQLRRLVDLADGRAESAMESRLRIMLVEAGLPRPLVQARLYDEDGIFLARPDLFYPDSRLVIEYDGGSHRRSLGEDNRRQNRLINAGYKPLRFTAPDVLRTPELVISQVRAAL
jgi:very-short-patch-repair endonuclease